MSYVQIQLWQRSCSDTSFSSSFDYNMWLAISATESSDDKQQLINKYAYCLPAYPKYNPNHNPKYASN